jgi:plasmid stabilization system protein ParE
MRTVAWSGRALTDLVGAINYLAQHNLPAAQRTEARILETVDRLARRPIGRPGKQPDTYEKRVTDTPYLLIYALSQAAGEEQIHIISLFHMAQD